MENNIYKAYAEVDMILSFMEVKYVKKIPKRMRELFGNDNTVCTFVSKRLYFRHIHFAVDIHALRFFCKNKGEIKTTRGCIGNRNSRCLDSQNFSNATILKPSIKFLADFVKQLRIHLVIKKTIHL